MRRVKILFTIPNFITAGSGQVMANILERLDKTRFETMVCVQTAGGRIYEELIARGYQVIVEPFTIPVRPYLSLIPRAAQAAKRFKALNIDLWHSFHYADDYTEPIIANFAGANGWVYTKKAMGWGSRAWKLRSLLASHIVADNIEMPHLFFNSPLLRQKVSVIHHGVVLDEYYPLPAGTNDLRTRLELSETTSLVGCVAHLVPVKGHPTLIQALSNLPETHLVLAGRDNDQEYANRLREEVATLKLEERVHFLGMVDNVPELMRDLDVVVLPTWNRWRKEGCPVALLEAMACGKACVATNIPGARDIIEDGVSGLLVEPENADALAGAIRRLINDNELRKEMGKAARVRVEEHFSIEKEVAFHEQLYKEIMTGKTTRRET